jgi:hypothetical protein
MGSPASAAWVEVLGGDYSYVPTRSAHQAGANQSLTMPLVARCPTRRIRIPETLNQTDKIDVKLDGATSSCELDPKNMALPLPSEGSATLTSGKTTLTTRWDVSTTRMDAVYTLVSWSWPRNRLFSGKTCPKVVPPAGVACRALTPQAEHCDYACSTTAPSRGFGLPLEVSFETGPGDIPSQRWTDKVSLPDETLRSFVRPVERTLEIIANGWRGLRAPNRAQTLELTLPNGSRIALAPDEARGTIDAKGVEINNYVRVDPTGQRPFDEKDVQVVSSTVVLPQPQELAIPFSASVLAAPSLEHNAFGQIGGLTEFAYAGTEQPSASGAG